MSLYVRGYRRIKPIDVLYDRYGRAVDPVTRQEVDMELFTPCINSEFDGRADDIEEREYEYASVVTADCRSYHSYSAFREWLSALAGYPAATGEQLKASGSSFDHRYRHHFSACEAGSGPFFELLDFSDCEGTIGTEVCRKLLQDFQTFADKVEQDTAEALWIKQVYRDLHAAFQNAADGGAVAFT